MCHDVTYPKGACSFSTLRFRHVLIRMDALMGNRRPAIVAKVGMNWSSLPTTSTRVVVGMLDCQANPLHTRSCSYQTPRGHVSDAQIDKCMNACVNLRASNLCRQTSSCTASQWRLDASSQTHSGWRSGHVPQHICAGHPV